MSKEQYVTFEVARLLKEKGFDWSTHKLYGRCRTYNGELIDFDTECELKDEGLGDLVKDDYALYDMWWVASELDLGYPCPTQQMVCRWLRERGIHIMPTIGCDVDRTPRIFYGAVIALFNDYGDIDYRDPLDENGYDEPEDAIEVALQYVLTNLI